MPLDHPIANEPALSAAGGEARLATRRGRPVGDRRAKRTELLKAAISVIAREGYVGASLRKVAQQADCTTGAVTYYFSSKEAMLVAVAESLFDEWDTLNENQDQVDLRVMIQQWFDWTNSDDPAPWLALFQLLAHIRDEPAFQGVLGRRYARYRAAFAAILARGQGQGVVRSDIPADLLADQLTAMCDGWMIAFPVEPEKYNVARIQALIDATMVMISPPAGAKTSG